VVEETKKVIKKTITQRPLHLLSSTASASLLALSTHTLKFTLKAAPAFAKSFSIVAFSRINIAVFLGVSMMEILYLLVKKYRGDIGMPELKKRLLAVVGGQTVGFIGTAFGSAIGLGIGSLFGPAGAAIGCIAGGVIVGGAGACIGNLLTEKIISLYNSGKNDAGNKEMENMARKILNVHKGCKWEKVLKMWKATIEANTEPTYESPEAEEEAKKNVFNVKLALVILREQRKNEGLDKISEEEILKITGIPVKFNDNIAV